MISFIKKIQRKIANFYNAKPCRLVPNKAVVTFTFDDVPRTAVTNGARILEEHNVAGTFFLSGSLSEQENLGLEQYAAEDIEILLNGGHEIGCHTYGHINIQNASAKDIKNDLDENFKYLKAYIGDRELTSFSYPFGCLSVRAKKVIRQSFSSARGIKSGVNLGVADLSQLKANALYDKKLTHENIRDLIKIAVEKNAWLIFYTHDISEMPTQFGCSPELLEFSVKQAIDQGAEILCMRSALARKTFK